MKVQQVLLVSLELEPANLVCWVEPIVKKGDKITLKEIPNFFWSVEDVYEQIIDDKTLYKPWRVGGLE